MPSFSRWRNVRSSISNLYLQQALKRRKSENLNTDMICWNLQWDPFATIEIWHTNMLWQKVCWGWARNGNGNKIMTLLSDQFYFKCFIVKFYGCGRISIWWHNFSADFGILMKTSTLFRHTAQLLSYHAVYLCIFLLYSLLQAFYIDYCAYPNIVFTT